MSAIISPCGKYRYRLERGRPIHIGPRDPAIYMPGAVAFFGVNPSTADATEDDPTIRKMMGFAARWGYRRIIVGNLFACRATDVKELRGLSTLDASGSDNLLAVHRIAEEAALVVPCWGSRDKLPKHLHDEIDRIAVILRRQNNRRACLGYTKSGDPKHPLMLGYNTPLQDW